MIVLGHFSTRIHDLSIINSFLADADWSESVPGDSRQS